jgi:hypothetical protein
LASEAGGPGAVNRVVVCELPAASLLRRYAGVDGYADCYRVDVMGVVTQAAYVEAFYTTWLFRIERTFRYTLRPPPHRADGELSLSVVPIFVPACRVSTPDSDLLGNRSPICTLEITI